LEKMKRFLLYLIPVLILAGCSSKDDSDYKSEAEEQISKGNVTGAITAYESLVKEFPESKFAPAALFEIGSLYQNKSVKNIGGRESMEKAAEIFKSVFDKYPKSAEAPKSLFMSGFIEANELGKFNEATRIYNLFLAKFPKHDLSDDAQLELDMMGLTPEEIINRKNSKPNI
jgi:TolA-binding protein